MEDKRKQNGGHSTKSKGIDKRKNNFKDALSNACTLKDVERVILALKESAFDGEVQAMKLFLEYYLGKPTQIIEQETTHKVVTGLDLKAIFADADNK